MRKSLLILSSFVLAFAGCVNEEELNYDETWNEDFDYTVDDDNVTVPSEITDTIDMRLFDVINLDYPGLEKVKQHYLDRLAFEQDETTGDSTGYYLAAAELLEYFRDRTNVSYPQIEASLMNATYTANEKVMADKALEGHFYVRNFTYPVGSGDYEDFADFEMVKDENDSIISINWGRPMPTDIPNGSEQEWDSQQHRHQWMLPQAKVYRATGDEPYIENWKGVYRNWVNSSPVPEGAETGHTVSSSDLQWYGLQPAERLRDQPSIFYYYLDSENFTPGYLSFFLSEFAKTANIIKSNPFGPVEEGHNITLAQNQALFYACTLFPEFKNAQEWSDYCMNNLEILNKNVFLSDGGPVERDASYHMGNVSNFYDIILIANANNVTFSSDFISNLEGGCEFMVDITYPGYTVDNFNDTRSDRMSRSVLRRNFGEYREMFPENNKFIYMSTERKDGSEPDDLVQVYPETGYYMLRTSWKADAAMMVIKNNPDGGWHCQYDNLTFGIYSNGISFSPDAGSFSYDTGSDRNTYAASGMHNVMVKPNSNISAGVNFDQGSRSGEFLGNGSGRNYEWVAGQNDNYPDLTHRRAAFLVDEKFFVLVDEGFGSYEGLVKLLFKGGNPEPANFNESNGSYTGGTISNFNFKNTKNNKGEGSVDPTLPVTMYTNLSGNSNIMFVTFPETTDGYDAQWTTGYFSNESAERTQRRIYEVCQTKPSGAVRFITVIYPYGTSAEYDNIKIDAEFTDNGFSQTGASVRVNVDNAGEVKSYNLTYTINQ